MTTKFHMCDMVFSPHFGKGIVTMIYQRDNSQFPICIEWIEENKPHYRGSDCFTLNGQYQTQFPDPDFDIIPIGEKGEEPKFKCTDRVFYPYYGYGTVVGDDKGDRPFPIRVFWDKPPYRDEPYSSFTRDGIMSISRFVGSDEVKLVLAKDISKEETGGSETKNMKEGSEKWMSLMDFFI